MYEGMQCPQPQPGTDGSHPAWPTTPGEHKHAPEGKMVRITDAIVLHGQENWDIIIIIINVCIYNTQVLSRKNTRRASELNNIIYT